MTRPALASTPPVTSGLLAALGLAALAVGSFIEVSLAPPAHEEEHACGGMAPDQRIEQVYALRAELEARPPVRDLVLPHARRPPSQTFLVVNMMTEAEHDLDGCFDEWSERTDEAGNPHDEANLIVRLTVGRDGVAHSSVATGETSPSLRFCVESAIGRIKFPTGPEQLDVEVAVGWSGGMIIMSPRVTAHRTVGAP